MALDETGTATSQARGVQILEAWKATTENLGSSGKTYMAANRRVKMKRMKGQALLQHVPEKGLEVSQRSQGNRW